MIVSLIIYIGDGFPIFYKQKRIGINNSKFLIYKFRTMKKDIPDIPTELVKNYQKLYIRNGSYLRKYSIDELPQLINIIKGDMAFVGPRPALYNQNDLIELRTKAGVHKIMPGITGWAQINGRDNINNAEKTILDTYYYNNQSFLLDLKIILITLKRVIKKKDILN